MSLRIRGRARKTGPKTLQEFAGSKRGRDDFRHLYKEYILALEIYVGEAAKLGQMLSACNGHGVNVVDQVALIAQRRRENDAHDEYIRARKRLLRSSGLRSTSKNSQRIRR